MRSRLEPGNSMPKDEESELSPSDPPHRRRRSAIPSQDTDASEPYESDGISLSRRGKQKRQKSATLPAAQAYVGPVTLYYKDGEVVVPSAGAPKERPQVYVKENAGKEESVLARESRRFLSHAGALYPAPGIRVEMCTTKVRWKGTGA